MSELQGLFNITGHTDSPRPTFQIAGAGLQGPRTLTTQGLAQRYPLVTLNADGTIPAGYNITAPVPGSGDPAAPLMYYYVKLSDGTMLESGQFSPVETSTGVVDLNVLLTSGLAQAASPEQLASLNSMLSTGNTLLPQMQQGITDNTALTTEAFGLLGINPAYVSDTTADPAGSPPDGTRGAKRDLSGNLVRLFRTGGAWVASGGALLATIATLSSSSLPGRVVNLEPTTLSLPSGVALPASITFQGQPGKTVIECGGGSGTWLNVANGQKADFRDVVLDGKNLISTGILANGAVRFVGGGIKNIQGTTSLSAYGIQQASTSTLAVVRDAEFSGYSGYEDGVIGNSIGAHRALLFQGTGGKAENCTFDGIGGYEDGDAVQFQTQTDTALVWTPAYGKVINCIFLNIKKRGVKVQASDVEVRGCFFGSTNLDPNTAVFAAVNIFGSRCKVSDNQFELPLAGAAIQVESGANDTLIQGNGINASVGSSETLVRSSSLKAILNIGNRTRISGNSINTAGIAVYLHGLSTYAQVSGNPLIRGGAACVLADTNTVGHTITHNTIGGTATQQLLIGVQLAGGSQRCVVMHNRYQYVTDGTRALTTATGHLVSQNIKGPGVTNLLNTTGMASDAYDTNQFTDAATFRSASGATLASPAFELLPGADPTTHYIGTRGDVLNNLTWRVAGTVVKFDGTAVPGISDFTAATLLGQNTPQSVISVDLATYPYPHTCEVIWGSGSLFQNGSSAYFPALWFKTIPPGLTGLTVEADYGSGYVTVATYTGITPALFWRAPTPAAIGAAIKLRFTLTGTATTGTLNWRRSLLYYSQLGDLETDVPSWKMWRVAHTAAGNHPSASVTLDPSVLAAGVTSSALNIFLSGVLSTDGIVITVPSSWTAGTFRTDTRVLSTGNISLYISNTTSGAIDLPSGTVTAYYIR